MKGRWYDDTKPTKPTMAHNPPHAIPNYLFHIASYSCFLLLFHFINKGFLESFYYHHQPRNRSYCVTQQA